MEKIYLENTLTRKKEEFIPIKKGEVGIYSCGPTVYGTAHIGNLRAYFFMDILVRMFEYNGYNVKNVMNITDVGHLVSDADTGEDKMMVASKREQKSPFEIAKYYEEIFMNDLHSLNIKTPKIIARATEHIKEMEEYVKDLLDKDFAYIAGDTIYFDTSKLEKRNFLDKQLEGKVTGKRVEFDSKKRNPEDFALWIKAPINHIMKWDSFFGKSYPGWHIECSAMSEKYLGKTFDIHTGGSDHIPVHHENEIIQSMGKNNVIPANYWLHTEFLNVDGGKMSKSLGNVYTLKDLKEKGFSGLDLRFLYLGTNYKKTLNFTFEAIRNAQISLSNLRKDIVKLKEKDNGKENRLLENVLTKEKSDYKKKFIQSINDNLNTSKALSIVWEILKKENAKEFLDLIFDFDKVLGLDLINSKSYLKDDENIEIDEEIDALLRKRDEARKNRDFIEADRIRNIFLEKGFILEDTTDGVILKKKIEE